MEKPPPPPPPPPPAAAAAPLPFPPSPLGGSASVESPPPKRCMSAAFMQCLAVVAMCAAIADPSWIEVHEMSRLGSDCCVFGVAYVLHRGGNFTQTGQFYLFDQNGITLMVLMATCCYLSILMGLLAFLLDFLLIKKLDILGVKIATLIHVFAALSSASAVVLCTCLFVIILNNAKEYPSQETDLITAFGESFFFAIFSFVVSVFAAILSFRAGRTLRRPSSVRNVRPKREESAPLLEEYEGIAEIQEHG
uniref:Transmembrane protein 127-like isoform X2 n=1 Tax=Geotrypetes seraphini TaxID=260995 RepID=A0A6P8RUT9_GEOSA|nr:transmembrane protein 127-like isoform X2 [Geotrypetes seraphini]